MPTYDAGAGAGPIPRAAGRLRRIHGVESPQLGNRRDLLVYLPPSYATGARHYPVLYLHDGQNLFDPATAFAGEWHVDDAMDALARDGIEAIVVGIPNMGPERADEYAPFRDERAGGGRGEAYLAFVVETIKPLVDERFRTRRGRTHTGIMGSSMGGLISLFALLRHPETFGLAGAMSPSLWFGGGAIFRVAEAAPRWEGRLYLDTGTAEGRPQVRQAREMARLLRRRAAHPRRQLRYVEERGAGHNEAAWAARFGPAVRWLLPRPLATDD